MCVCDVYGGPLRRTLMHCRGQDSGNDARKGPGKTHTHMKEREGVGHGSSRVVVG